MPVTAEFYMYMHHVQYMLQLTCFYNSSITALRLYGPRLLRLLASPIQFGHLEPESLEKQIMQGTILGSRTKGRLKTTQIDNIHSLVDWIHIGQDARVF